MGYRVTKCYKNHDKSRSPGFPGLPGHHGRSCKRVGSWVATCFATPWRNGIFWPTSGIPTLCCTGGKCCCGDMDIYGNGNYIWFCWLNINEYVMTHFPWILPIENGTISFKWRLSFFLFGGSSAMLHCCCLWRVGARKHMEQKSDAVTKMTKLLVNVPLEIPVTWSFVFLQNGAVMFGLVSLP